MADIEDDEDYEVVPQEPLVMYAEQVMIADGDLLARDSGAEGVIAIRVTADLEVEYLDGASRVWLNAAVPAGPQRKKN